MRQINIYLEGKGDVIFISQFLAKRFNLVFKYDFVRISSKSELDGLLLNVHTFLPESGYGGLNSRAVSRLVEAIKSVDAPVGIESVIILDADTIMHTDPKGGFESRRSYMEGLLAGSSIKYFIIPNHKDDGNLEVLLEKVISPEGQAFYQCLSSYVSCLAHITDNKPIGLQEVHSLNKIKLEWYTYMMLGKKRAKEKKDRDYLETRLWDLEASDLEALKLFFEDLFDLSSGL